MTKKAESQELFNDLVGQPTVISLLSAAIKKNRISNAYLFAGPHGVGRRLAALRFLEGLLNDGKPEIRERRRLEALNHPDLLCVEPTYLHQGKIVPQSIAEVEQINRRTPPKIRLEQIRDITKFLGNKPLEASLGMVIIEDIETMAEAAANALLKTLEEPGNGLLILITSRPERILSTIQSRCQKIPFNRLKEDDLQRILYNNQNTQKTPFDFTLGIQQKEIINLASGSPGAFLKHLKTWQEIPNELWNRLEPLPQNPLDALSLARDITEALDIEQQIWLIDWLQQHIWIKENNVKQVKRLEKLRSHLLAFVQPRLAWEITFLELNSKQN